MATVKKLTPVQLRKKRITEFLEMYPEPMRVKGIDLNKLLNLIPFEDNLLVYPIEGEYESESGIIYEINDQENLVDKRTSISSYMGMVVSLGEFVAFDRNPAATSDRKNIAAGDLITYAKHRETFLQIPGMKKPLTIISKFDIYCKIPDDVYYEVGFRATGDVYMNIRYKLKNEKTFDEDTAAGKTPGPKRIVK